MKEKEKRKIPVGEEWRQRQAAQHEGIKEISFISQKVSVREIRKRKGSM